MVNDLCTEDSHRTRIGQIKQFTDKNLVKVTVSISFTAVMGVQTQYILRIAASSYC